MTFQNMFPAKRLRGKRAASQKRTISGDLDLLPTSNKSLLERLGRSVFRHAFFIPSAAQAPGSPPAGAAADALPADGRRRRLMQSLAAAPLLAGGQAGAAEEVGEGEAVQGFALADVRLLDGPFRKSQDLNLRYLTSLNCDRLLHNFRANAGLAPRAPVYGGWESSDLCPGHTLGHFLSAASMMWAATGQAAMRERVDYVVGELRACHEARPDQLVCGFPDRDTQLRNCLAGQPTTGVPWYTMHKIMAGLRDAHVHASSADALVIAARMADWIDEAARPVDDVRFQKMLDLEHGGMNEVLADLHALTGEARYLRLAERFSHRVLLEPLAEGRDTLDGLHANTQIPKVVGFARLHRLTGRMAYQRAARYFWTNVVERRSYATGGHGDEEKFFPPPQAEERLGSVQTMETCGTYNMLRLTHALFAASPSANYADYHERALLNGILASQDPDSGMVTYFQATRPNYRKHYCKPEQSFWCCTGTGMENHAKHGDSIYFHSNKALYVNLYIASDLHWAGQGVRVRQITRFPEQGATRLAFTMVGPREFSVRLRHPGWCRRLTVRLNGRTVIDSDQAARYVEIKRTWHDGDVLDVEMPMHLQWAPLPGAPGVAAIMYGPLVLAARLGRDGYTPGSDVVAGNGFGMKIKEKYEVPVLRLNGAGIETVVRRAARGLVFDLNAPGQNHELVPFHRIAHERYNLYWAVG